MAGSASSGTNWGDFVLWLVVALIAGTSLGMLIAWTDAQVLLEVTQAEWAAYLWAALLLFGAINLTIAEWSRLRKLVEDPVAMRTHSAGLPIWIGSVPVALVVTILYAAAIMATVAAPGTGLPKESFAMRFAVYVVLGTGMATAFVLIVIHLTNGLGQRLHTMLRSSGSSSSSSSKGADEAGRTRAQEREAGSPDTGFDGVVERRSTAGASSASHAAVPAEAGEPRDVPGRDGTTSKLYNPRKAAKSSEELAAASRPFSTVPPALMWLSLLLFVASGFFFGAVFTTTNEDNAEKRQLGLDLELTLAVGGGIGAVIGFWSFFIHRTQGIGPDGRTKEQMDADEALRLRSEEAFRGVTA